MQALPATPAINFKNSLLALAWDKFQQGRAQDSYDKQYVRDYLEQIHWNKQPPAPALPVEVARHTSDKYLEAFHQLTGHELDV